MIPVIDPYNFFDTLPPEVQAEIDAASRFSEVPKGGLVMRQGELSDHLHQVLGGEVKVSSTSHGGRETALALIRAGGWVSLSEIFSGLPATADVTALTPVRVRSVARTTLQALMRQHPQIAEALLRVLSLRCSILYHFSVDRSVLTLKERVIKLLYMQAYSQGARSGSPLIPLPQEELGKLLGTGRQTLNRMLKELAREGLLEATYGGVRLLDLENLRARYAYLIDVDQPVAVYRA